MVQMNQEISPRNLDEGKDMPSNTSYEREILSKKIKLLVKFRGYIVQEEKEENKSRDIIVTRKDEIARVLARVVYETTLVSGKIGVSHIRKLKERMAKEEFESGIIIGEGFSYSARKEAKSYDIETIENSRIPTFNIFNHHLVPKHKILSKHEAQDILTKYHVEPHQLPRIKVSDPAVFLIGAKPGNIIRIERESPTAGIYETYRHVI